MRAIVALPQQDADVIALTLSGRTRTFWRHYARKHQTTRYSFELVAGPISAVLDRSKVPTTTLHRNVPKFPRTQVRCGSAVLRLSGGSRSQDQSLETSQRSGEMLARETSSDQSSLPAGAVGSHIKGEREGK
jgi:hypothetical protein